VKEKHVVIDGCCLGRRKTGNETYLRGLLTGLAEVAPPDWRFTVLVTSAHTGPRDPRFAWQEIPLGNFWTRNFLLIPRALAKLRPDLFHGVYWFRYFAPSCPTVLMVHDLSFVSFPAGFHWHEQLIYAYLVKACARKARHLLTVSEFSKVELVEKWAILKERITVTYDGLDKCFRPAKQGASETKPPPYILYVGNLHPRKNIVRLLEAFTILKNTSSLPHRLRIVGQSAWLAGEIFQKVRESDLAGEIEFTGYISQDELVRCYQEAAVCVYPSLYEGFGLPVLEAMACGCPVICSKTTSIPEVAGEACCLVDPTSSSDIAGALDSLLSNPAELEKLRARGLQQAKKFTWESCAMTTLEGYSKALSPSSK
jgi:glycosyltransferase involved in cell wall biosynthesis